MPQLGAGNNKLWFQPITKLRVRSSAHCKLPAHDWQICAGSQPEEPRQLFPVYKRKHGRVNGSINNKALVSFVVKNLDSAIEGL